MANGHGGIRTGAGRPPGAETEWNEYDAITDSYFWVEGRITVLSHDEETRVKRDKVIVLLKELGLTPQLAPVGSSYNTEPRRRWSTKAIPLWEVAAVIKDHPGKHLPFLAKEVYCPKNHLWDEWTPEQQKNAEAKLLTAFTKLTGSGKVVRRYDYEGKAVYFPAGSKDIVKYAKTRSGRHQLDIPPPPILDELQRAVERIVERYEILPKKKLEKSKR